MNPSRVALLVVALTLLVPVFATTTAAQVPTFTMAGSSLLPDAENAKTVLDDPQGDAATDFFAVTVPETQVDGSIDILRVDMAETQGELLLAWTHREYDEASWAVGRASLGNYFCRADLVVNGHDGRTFTVFVRAENRIPSNGQLYGYIYQVETSGDSWDYEYLGAIDTAFAAGRLESVIPKDVLSVGGVARGLAVGDELEVTETVCYHSQTLLFVGSVYDVAGREHDSTVDGRYEVQMAAGSDVLALGMVQERYRDNPTMALSVATGMTVRHPVEFTNIGDRKLITLVEARIEGPDGAALPDWKLQVPEHVEIPAGKSVPVSVLVAPPNGTQPGAEAVLVIEATPIGDDDTVSLRRALTVTVPLGPDADTLYGFNGWRGSCWPFACASADMPNLFEAETEWIILSPTEDDPRYTREDVDDGAVVVYRGYDFGVVVWDAMVAPVALDPDGVVDFQLTLASPVEREVFIEVEAVADWWDTYLGETTVEATIGPGPTTVTIPIPMAFDEKLHLDVGSTIQLMGRVGENTADFYLYGTHAEAEVRAAGTQATFPFVPTDTGKVTITDGRALPTLQVRGDTETEAYVNPGKTAVFDLALVNEGIESDVLEIDVEATDPDWGITIEPGKRFKLEPGQRAPFSVVVRAPADAAEADNVTLRVLATSANDAKVSTELRLDLVVTADIEIDEERYEDPDEEVVTPYIDEAEEASGIGAWVLVSGVLAALGAVRRRD